MKKKEDFFIHIQHNDIEAIQKPNNSEIQSSTGIYILTRDSFINYPNFDVNCLINNNYILSSEQIKKLQKSEIKLNYTYNEIMELKKNKIDFFILDEIKVKKVLRNIGIEISKLYESKEFYLELKKQNLVYFSEENKYIHIKPHLNENLFQNQNRTVFHNVTFINSKPKSNINDNRLNQTLRKQENNSFNKKKIHYDEKSKIIQILILLYGNEKEIMRYYSQGIYDLKNYFLINKAWVEKFKEKNHYNEIYNILISSGINTLNECLQQLTDLQSSLEIKSVYNKININNSSLNQISFSLKTKKRREFNEYVFPIDFYIIHESILSLIKTISNCIINSEYEISFGKSSLCLRLKNQLCKIYFYNYNNNSFNITGVIELFQDFWKPIYQKHFSKISFKNYLINKKINLNIINKKQNLFSADNTLLGYVFLLSQIDGNKDKIIITQNKISESEGKINRTRKINGQNSRNQNNENLLKNPDKLRIIRSLILLYGNEKEINRLYSLGYYNLKKCYLVNNSWIEKYKEIYYYNEVHNVLTSHGIKTFCEACKNIKYLESLNEIKNIYNKIIIDENALIQFNLTPVTTISGENSEYVYPVNFIIIHESVYNLIKKFSHNQINSEYEINFGKSSLYLRLNYDLNKMYIFYFNNKAFRIAAIIEIFADVWKYIYDKHLSKKPFKQYLTEKNINLNIINQKQNLLSEGSKLLGYIYLTSKIFQKTKEKPKVNINQNNDFYFKYKNLLNSLKTLKHNKLDLPNNDIIQSYLSSHLLINLKVYIIETQKLKYCFDTINQLKNVINDFSFCLSENDIKSCDLISESTKYSFINEEIIKYFKIQNINNLAKAFLFVNKNSAYIFYPVKKYLLKVLNYNNNTFNLKKLSFSPSPNFSLVKVFTLGLENIGATSYINTSLQCLSHINLVKNYFLNDQKYNQDILSRNALLSKSLADVIRKLWSQTYETFYAPHDFKNLISHMNPLFQGIKDNDSKDLLLFLYENIHNELNDPAQNPNLINFFNINNNNNGLYQFRQNYYSQNYSIISDIFYFENCNTVQCQNCNFLSNNFSMIYYIEFPLENIRLFKQNKYNKGFSFISLNDCFEYNEQPINLEGANKIHCTYCLNNTDALIYNKLITLPKVLTIILNYGNNLENQVEFSFPKDISLEKYITDKTNNSNYHLIGVIAHHGLSGMNGHFVAYCKSPVNGQWYFYNDKIVAHCQNEVKSETLMNGKPYILFYQRK